jgi:hypothetical protein
MEGKLFYEDAAILNKDDAEIPDNQNQNISKKVSNSEFINMHPSMKHLRVSFELNNG